MCSELEKRRISLGENLALGIDVHEELCGRKQWGHCPVGDNAVSSAVPPTCWVSKCPLKKSSLRWCRVNSKMGLIMRELEALEATSF